MSGIYLHIPFCKQACHYCDFHFSTNTQIRKDLIHAMEEEIRMQHAYLGGEPLQTVYFGGGTPSMLEVSEIKSLLDGIRRTHRVSAQAEITLEANPDDLSLEKLTGLRSIGINRLSIGIQSFDDAILRSLNRVHSAASAIQSVRLARAAGFENLSIDLIYAMPGLSADGWAKTIKTALSLDTPHVSAYTLTIEEKTTFGNWLRKGKLTPVDESVAAAQMETLVAAMAANAYKQYEISNFAREGFESQHNSNYWKGGKYLGIGPSAHSYDGSTRQHNIPNNHLYIRAISERRLPAEQEVLKKSEQINEYILTSLRTTDGTDLEMLRTRFAYDVPKHHGAYLRELEKRDLVHLEAGRLKLTENGKLLADRISSDLFLVE